MHRRVLRVDVLRVDQLTIDVETQTPGLVQPLKRRDFVEIGSGVTPGMLAASPATPQGPCAASRESRVYLDSAHPSSTPLAARASELARRRLTSQSKLRAEEERIAQLGHTLDVWDKEVSAK
jgi:hypothetical protein